MGLPFAIEHRLDHLGLPELQTALHLTTRVQSG